jgi:uncharacterized membrane protein
VIGGSGEPRPRPGPSAGHDPEAARQRRIAREEAEAREIAAAREQSRQLSASALIISGTVLLAVGFWFLVVNPSGGEIDGTPIANLHRLTLGETTAIVGAVFLTGGLWLRFR